MAGKKKPKRSRWRFRKRRVHRDRTFPLAMIPSFAVPVGTMISGDSELMGIAKAATQYLPAGDWGNFSKEAINSLSHQTIGYIPYNNKWDIGIIGRNLALIIGGVAVHKLATWGGVNRKMKNIPLIGKYVSI